MRFDLSKYSTVAERLAQFHKDHPDGRVVTKWANDMRWDVVESKPPRTWVIKATIYLNGDDQREGAAKATGYAFETDGTGGANNTSALENAETSAIGRALMVMGYSMNKDPNALASREEMEKVIRAERDWVKEASNLEDVEALRLLWSEAKAAAAPKAVLDKVAARAKSVDSRSVNK